MFRLCCVTLKLGQIALSYVALRKVVLSWVAVRFGDG